ncbi:MAG: hypothetical protein ACE37E_01320 [Hyphomicrobiales bacterium]
MGEERDPPIDDIKYLSGLTVVDIGDLRVARGKSRRPYSGCDHRSVVYDQHERRIWCKDCERNVEPFDAFVALAERYGTALDNLERRRKEITEAEGHTLRSRAAKVMDDHWRSTKHAPCCPHCREALLPEDVLRPLARMGKEIERARRAKAQGKPDA